MYIFNITTLATTARFATLSSKSIEARSMLLRVSKRICLIIILDLFKNELKKIRFTYDPNIVQFYQIFQDHHTYHLVTELCENSNIASYPEKKGACNDTLAKNHFPNTSSYKPLTFMWHITQRY